MELFLTTRVRIACLAVGVAAALGLGTLVAGTAAAGPETVGLADAAPTAAKRSVSELKRGLVAHQRQLERERARAQRAAEAEQLGEVKNEAGEALELSSEACEENVGLAASKGLKLPKGWKIHCVGPALDWNGGSHWGVTCPYEECPEGDGPYVSISNPNYYVVAHELCHANFGNDELMADRCAADHGASLETSPYS